MLSDAILTFRDGKKSIGNSLFLFFVEKTLEKRHF